MDGRKFPRLSRRSGSHRSPSVADRQLNGARRWQGRPTNSQGICNSDSPWVPWRPVKWVETIADCLRNCGRSLWIYGQFGWARRTCADATVDRSVLTRRLLPVQLARADSNLTEMSGSGEWFVHLQGDGQCQHPFCHDPNCHSPKKRTRVCAACCRLPDAVPLTSRTACHQATFSNESQMRQPDSWPSFRVISSLNCEPDSRDTWVFLIFAKPLSGNSTTESSTSDLASRSQRQSTQLVNAS